MNSILHFFSNFWVELLGGIIALLGGIVTGALIKFIEWKLEERFALHGKRDTKTYREQIGILTQSLAKASEDVDRILQEMTDVSNQREKAVTKLEKQLNTLTEREKELQKKVNTLEKVPLPAIEYFANIVEKGEKKSAWRDYALFGSGVVVSTVIAILLRLFGV